MMNKKSLWDRWRKLLCRLFGHRYICLFRRTNVNGSEFTGWMCQRCDNRTAEQWDEPV